METDRAPHSNAKMSIRELATKYGVTLRTIRFYESIGLLRPDRIGQGRLFSAHDETLLRLTLTGKKLGLALSEIQKIVQEHIVAKGKEPDTLSEVLDRATIEKQITILQEEQQLVDAAIKTLREALQR